MIRAAIVTVVHSKWTVDVWLVPGPPSASGDSAENVELKGVDVPTRANLTATASPRVGQSGQYDSVMHTFVSEASHEMALRAR